MASVNKRRWPHNGVEKEAWIVRYVDHSGKRRGKTFNKKKDADAYKRKVEADMDNGLHVPDGDTDTIKGMGEKLLRHLELRQLNGGLSRQRLYIYRLAFDRGVVPYIGNVKLSELKFSHLDAWWLELSKTSISERTRRDYLKCLKVLESFAIKRGASKKAVVPGFIKELGTLPEKPIRVLNSEQVGRLLEVVEERPKGKQRRTHAILRCAVHLAAFCGLRFGEIMGLTVVNLDLDAQVIQVRHSLNVFGELKGPKTAAGRRDVPIPSHVAEMLREWLRTSFIPNERGLVFRTDGGGDMALTNFHKFCWKPLLRRAGLWDEGGDQYHFHALRHFAASFMIQNGLPVTDVASMLGHRKFDTTLQVYAHPIVGGSRRLETAETMARLLLVSDTRETQETLTP
ncbi:hypothetical protein C1S70_31475 (plasmid) [Azospirillum argentinense]|uniref:Site-specific integrase n=1 Tax=Azospirillum argentinense TaxID=2970906 RepID=A0A2K1FRA6_9PROT|nr:site-specific integrase [Azospirillum argentinense]PNQ94979.1 hypothetical protein C1S70_31475 [Azospirillum argentinense]